MENGIKYNISEIILICIIYKYEKGWICFWIVDNGIGIDSEYSEYIFKMFKCLYNSSFFLGIGIGLFICKCILEGWGG